MMFVRWARAALALCVPCAMSAVLSSCGGGHTIGYVYTASNGQTAASGTTLYSFEINSEVGGITPIANASASVSNATSSLVTTAGTYLYVASASGVSVFSISRDSGNTAAGSTVQTPGASAIALASDLANKYLFVLDQYAAGFSAANPGPGAVNVYTIGTSGALALTGTYRTDTAPQGIAALPNAGGVYVTTAGASGGLIDQFAVGSSGALTALGSVNCGITPIGIAAEPTDRFLYASDFAQNQIYGYVVGAGFTLTQVISSPFTTVGLGPIAMVVEPRGKYLFSANYRSSSVTGYAIELSNGSLSQIGVNATGTGPVAVAVDPLQGTYIYTANNLDNSITAFTLKGSTGVLGPVQNSPFHDVGEHPATIAIAPNSATPIPGNP